MSRGVPALDKASADELNLRVLRRLDPAVEQVLAVAGHVALYDFDTAAMAWSRKDMEGSLFLVRRSVAPLFEFIILNKKSASNYVEDVLGGFVFEQNKPYILYRNRSDEVIGIWFYNDDENDAVAGLLQHITATYGEGGAASATPAAVASDFAAAAAPAESATAAAPAAAPAPAVAVNVPAHTQPVTAPAPAAVEESDDNFWDARLPANSSTAAAADSHLMRKLQGAPAPRAGPALPPPAAPASAAATRPSQGAASDKEKGDQLDPTLARLFSNAHRPSATGSAPAPPPVAPPLPPPRSPRHSQAVPELLPPSFFQQAPPAALPEASGASDLHRLFAKAALTPATAGRTASLPPPQPHPAAPASLSDQAAAALPPPAVAGAAHERAADGVRAALTSAEGAAPAGGVEGAARQSVRTALLRLAQDDAFVDAVARELLRAGFTV